MGECVASPFPERSMSWKDIAWLHASMRTTIFAMFMGAGLTIGLTFFENVFAIIIGLSVVVIIMTCHGLVGQKTGKSLFEFARYSFGEFGSKILISGLMLVMTLGWNGIGLSLVAFAINAFFGLPRSYLIFVIIVIIYGILILIPPLFGIEKMAKISWIPFVLTIALSGYLLYVVLQTFTINEILTYTPTVHFSLIYGIDLVIGNSIGYALGVTNFTMKMECDEKIWFAFIIGFGIPGALMMVIGMLLATQIHTFNLILIMESLNLNAIAYLLIIISLYILFGAGIYNIGLALKNVFEGSKIQISERGYMAISGVLGIIAAISGIFDYLFEWLSFLSISISPIMGILLADYFFVHRQIQNRKTNDLNYMTFIIWIFSVVIAILTPTYLLRSMISFFIGFSLYFLYNNLIVFKKS